MDAPAIAGRAAKTRDDGRALSQAEHGEKARKDREYQDLVLKLSGMKASEKNVRVRKVSMKEATDDLRNTTPEERWAMMWRLAQDAWAFKGDPVAEPGLQRHIVRVYRRKS
jgi:hypothetical protein